MTKNKIKKINKNILKKVLTIKKRYVKMKIVLYKKRQINIKKEERKSTLKSKQ